MAAMGCSDKFVKTGLMTWFCCGSGWGPCAPVSSRGACGTCHSSYRQCAWPNISDACRAITRPEDCGISIPRYGCGHGFYVVNKCSGKCTFVRVADCGPDTNAFCGQFSSCGEWGGRNRIIDLTPAAWAAIASLEYGIRPCWVRN